MVIKEKCDKGITLLQEAHCDPESECSWERLSFFSHGTHNSCGVITLVGKNIDFKLLNKETDSKGRLIIIYGFFQEAHLLIINTYAPNTEKEQLLFFSQVYEKISAMNIDNSTKIIWGGDFNLCFSKDDTDGGNYKPKVKSISLLKTIMEELNICDIWRVRNPDSTRYTWKTLNPLVQRRLDFFLISNDLQIHIGKADIKPAISTDHSAITLELKPCDHHPHGPSYWRFNTSLLNDTEYKEVLQNKILIWKNNFHSDDPRELWEYLKFCIRNFTIRYSKNKAKKFKTE